MTNEELIANRAALAGRAEELYSIYEKSAGYGNATAPEYLAYKQARDAFTRQEAGVAQAILQNNTAANPGVNPYAAFEQYWGQQQGSNLAVAGAAPPPVAPAPVARDPNDRTVMGAAPLPVAPAPVAPLPVAPVPMSAAASPQRKSFLQAPPGTRIPYKGGTLVMGTGGQMAYTNAKGVSQPIKARASAQPAPMAAAQSTMAAQPTMATAQQPTPAPATPQPALQTPAQTAPATPTAPTPAPAVGSAVAPTPYKPPKITGMGELPQL